MSENEKKRTRAEQKIVDETKTLKEKENDVVRLTATLDEENRKIKKLFLMTLFN